MAAAKKPTAQQKAQAKARAGGNDPIKVTKAGVKRLGQGALIAASLTPAGRGVKAASMAVKAVKAAKSAKAVKSSRQAYDYPVSGKSAKSVVPKLGKKSVDISENVSIKNATSPSGKVSIGGGANQVSRENLRITSLKYSNAEAKANARGLKAANKPTNKTGSAMNKRERKYFQGKDEMIKSMQNTERAGLSKSSRKITKKK